MKREEKGNDGGRERGGAKRKKDGNDKKSAQEKGAKQTDEAVFFRWEASPSLLANEKAAGRFKKRGKRKRLGFLKNKKTSDGNPSLVFF